MNKQIISHIDLWKVSVDCKFVIIFAKGTGHIVYMVAGRIFLAQHRDVMISTVHRGTHQVRRARIHADIFFVNMLLMHRLRYQRTVRSHHETSHLGINCDISHACRNQYLFVNLSDALADRQNIVRLLIGTIRNADTARQIDKRNIRSGFFFQLHSKLKQLLCQLWIIFVRHRVARQKCVNTKAFYSLAL